MAFKNEQIGNGKIKNFIARCYKRNAKKEHKRVIRRECKNIENEHPLTNRYNRWLL